MTVGERIKAARKQAGLTQKELAERLGLSFQAIAQWENNLRKPKLETLRKFAAALSVDVWEFIEDSRVEYDSVEDFDLDYRNMMEFLEKYPKGEVVQRPDGVEYYKDRNRHELEMVYNRLNDVGQEKAVERIRELAEIPKYQRQTPENVGEVPLTPSKDKDTTQED